MCVCVCVVVCVCVCVRACVRACMHACVCWSAKRLADLACLHPWYVPGESACRVHPLFFSWPNSSVRLPLSRRCRERRYWACHSKAIDVWYVSPLPTCIVPVWMWIQQPASLDARLFFFLVLALRPAVTMDEAIRWWGPDRVQWSSIRIYSGTNAGSFLFFFFFFSWPNYSVKLPPLRRCRERQCWVCHSRGGSMFDMCRPSPPASSPCECEPKNLIL